MTNAERALALVKRCDVEHRDHPGGCRDAITAALDAREREAWDEAIAVVNALHDKGKECMTNFGTREVLVELRAAREAATKEAP